MTHADDLIHAAKIERLERQLGLDRKRLQFLREELCPRQPDHTVKCTLCQQASFAEAFIAHADDCPIKRAHIRLNDWWRDEFRDVLP